MQSILRDFLLSFCPAKVRKSWRPSSQLTILRAAMWSGVAQVLLSAWILLEQFKHFFIMRSQQMAPHMDQVNSTGAAVVTALVVLKFLFHPLSLFLLYIALEGAVRFIGSLVTSETVPGLLVVLFFKLSDLSSRSIRRPMGPAIADALERLPDNRICIASAAVKGGWNSSVTIGIDGQWFEVERRAGSAAASVCIRSASQRRRERYCAVISSTPLRRWRLSLGKMARGLTTEIRPFISSDTGYNPQLELKLWRHRLLPLLP